MNKGFLSGAYDHGEGDEARRFYDAWAASYNAELDQHGYVTPKRCADALAAALEDPTTAILDLGCGTGLSGCALQKAGFTRIDGWDPSAEMLQRAEASQCYRVLRQIDPDQPLTARPGTYGAVNAAGVMSPGLAPPEAMDQVLDMLAPDGLFCFSLNDHAMKDGGHYGRLNELVDAGAAEVLFKEYGDHIPGTDMKAWVFVLRKR